MVRLHTTPRKKGCIPSYRHLNEQKEWIQWHLLLVKSLDFFIFFLSVAYTHCEWFCGNIIINILKELILSNQLPDNLYFLSGNELLPQEIFFSKRKKNRITWISFQCILNSEFFFKCIPFSMNKYMLFNT